jgi:hypothetical protein
MSETKKTNEPGDGREDWAILPFDETEDDERWARLSAEMDELEKEVDAHEAVHGKILMKEDFSRFQTNDNAKSLAKYDEAFEDNPF